MRGELVALRLEQQLRRGADHLELRGPHEEQVRARVDPAEAPIQPDAVERAAGRRVGREVEGLASREHDLDRLAGRDRVLGHLDRVDVLLAAEARVDGAGERRGAVASRRRAGELGGARARGPLQRLEDGRLGDPVAAFEVGRVGVERGDRRQRVGQVVEDEDQVGLDERRRRDADRVVVRERDGGLEGRHGVVGDGPDGAAGEPWHPVGRFDPAAADELADRVERIGRGVRLDRQVGGVGRDRDGSGLDPGATVADLEESARADAEEGVAAQPLAAFDRLEEVGRIAVVEAQEGTDRGLEVGRARGAQADRVRVAGEPFGLAQADWISGGHRWASRIRYDRSSPGRKVVPSAVPPSFGDAALS